MKKSLCVVAAIAWSLMSAGGAELKVCDFEDYEIGHVFKIWNFWGSLSESTAVVETDPANASNKVLHVTLKNWNDYIEFDLDDELSGASLTDRYVSLSADIRRHANDPVGEWKNFEIILGSEKLYSENFPSYGKVSEWKNHTYDLSTVSEENNSDKLRLGFNSDGTDYYIDNIVLDGYDIYPGGELRFGTWNTSSSYTNYDASIKIPEGTTLDVYTSRYTYWMSTVIGSGCLNIRSGGERCYLGNEKGAQYPDWTGFIGDVHVYPWTEISASKPGFYGLIMTAGGKKFDSDDIKGSILDKNYTPILEDNKVFIHKGATMAAEGSTNARAFRFGRLETEAGSTLMGHYKSGSQRVYYIVGRDGSDSELAGDITPTGSAVVGLVKEGRGTYRITGNNNNISGVLSIVGGKVLIDNDIEAARTSRLSGAVGLGSNTAGVIVYTGGCVGGNGHISALTDVYGHLEPGSTIPGTLTIADFVKSNTPDLRVHPTSRLIFKILRAGEADCLSVSGKVVLDDRKESLEVSDEMPVIEIKLPVGHDLKDGDEFTLLTASGVSEGLNFRVQYPKAYSWSVEQKLTDIGYVITAKVISTDYSGQGDKVIEDEYGEESLDNSDYIIDYTKDYDDPVPLRVYAERLGKSIGVAIPSSRFDLANPADPRSSLAMKEFNLVVAENEMKIDWTEGSQGEFSLNEAEKLINYASDNHMEVRGHTLVWHSQVPSWISSDGRKNNHNYTRQQLLDIVKGHIDGVAGGLKGKIREWDVVNEVLDDNQSVVRDNPEAFNLRASVWKAAIGDDFIEQAFSMAREADPDARLYINDYGVEFMGQPKAEAYYNLVKSLVEKGVKIDGVGLQCHISVGELNASRLASNIARYKDLGLDVAITELDIAQANPYAPDAQKRQAEEYCAAVYAALSQSNCPTVLIWGLRDTDSWRANNPLLYDGDLKAKEAYYGVHAALRTLVGQSGVEPVVVAPDADIISIEWYNLQGQPVPSGSTGFLIKRIVRADGSAEAIKVLVK